MVQLCPKAERDERPEQRFSQGKLEGKIDEEKVYACHKELIGEPCCGKEFGVKLQDWNESHHLSAKFYSLVVIGQRAVGIELHIDEKR